MTLTTMKMALSTTTEVKQPKRLPVKIVRQQRQRRQLSFVYVVVVSCLLVCNTVVVVHAQQLNSTTTNGNGDDDGLILPDPDDGVNNSTINGNEISRPPNFGIGVPCYVCGGDSTDTITNGDVMQLLPDGTKQLSCQTIYQDGINGLIPDDHCCVWHNDISFFNTCGCVVTTTTPAVSKVGGTGGSNGTKIDCSSAIQNGNNGGGGGGSGNGGGGPPRGVCYPCNNDSSATVSNPDVLIPIQNGQSTRSCNEILNDGKQGIIPTFECPIFQNYTLQFQQQCGCTYNSNNTNGPSTSGTTSAGIYVFTYISFTTTTLLVTATIISSSILLWV